ncbi:MAG: hypothetical protein H6581_18415 [Bacteroidia bacterium]|nr:hypothetical protein [Bacteroidia bacterium]
MAKIEISGKKSKAAELKGWAKFRFLWRVSREERKADQILKETLKRKECWFGPFKGEFGNFLGHVLPVLSWLHQQGVKIHYCGLGLHEPLMVDEQGKLIVHEFFKLRDFFAEVSPATNKTVPPADVQAEIDTWMAKAEASGMPVWNIGYHFYYWFVFRHLPERHGCRHAYDLSKVYKTRDEFSAVVFPRSKGITNRNQGEAWDYVEVADALSPYFDKVYLVGHPSQSLGQESRGNIEVSLSADNQVMLERVANASLLVTQHSGAVYLGEYLHAQPLVIFKGQGPIGSFYNTSHWVKNVGEKYKLEVAESLDEVKEFCEKLKAKYAKT